MKISFSQLKNEYLATAMHASITSAAEQVKLAGLARKLLAGKEAFYRPVSEMTGVPMLWLMVINERESGGRFDTYLGNGQPLNRVTTAVPRGRGPWRSWAEGAADALGYDHVTFDGPEGWTLPWFLYRAEAWNGFGPRMRGKRSGYLWAGTTIYTGGKYVQDGVWSPLTWDTQPGCWALAKALLDADAGLLTGLAPGFAITPETDPSGATPCLRDHIPPDEQALDRVTLLQDGLNRVAGYGLTLDGSFGRHTRSALRKYQTLHGLVPDEIAGPLTWAALKADLTALQQTAKPTKPKDFPMDLINALGEALGLTAPHTPRSVAQGAVKLDPAELADGLIAAHNELTPLSVEPVAQFVDPWASLGWHIVTAAGSILVGSGLFDPAGPLAGMARAHPLLGAVLAILGPLANWWSVRSANDKAAGK